ncbi:Trehalose phosphorylase [Penicillium oxalicum]|uniref:Putative trehalose phosphorylase n=1 Tax=Penicillium oxalicum (strain 114-2 / CGMCC 5302) TaxID=933388 RepID=S8AUX5_PENO1|nr:Trehalose phosphorylase [Penicillium oxalicum]EPS29988.1 putative trehalose phosphorylase [Penicillium oxalicum 114-2]KAI2792950.1 Trehalose phosphorylase [Penicillium oxalicum]
MALDASKFDRQPSATLQRRLSEQYSRFAWTAPPSESIYAGITISISEQRGSTIAVAIRDATYLLDFIEKKYGPGEQQPCSEEAVEFVISQLRRYAEKHLEKVLGIAMHKQVAGLCPKLCSRLWAELDILPLVLPGLSLLGRFASNGRGQSRPWEMKDIDEQADSMARKCVRLFGPENCPLLQVGNMGVVEVDTDFHVRLTNLGDFEKTVSAATWKACNYFAKDLKKRGVKIAFFSATPQGGGVALMRHALLRFSHSLGTDIKWYVPRPRPGVFRVTKRKHNILQGITPPEERLTGDDINLLAAWIGDNAKRYWTIPGGPLCAPADGGADVLIIDDPQMPGLIPIAKKIAPQRPIIFRSHIQIRSDLVNQPGTSQADAWKVMWENVKQADCFIAHPVKAFVPRDVPSEMVGYMPATTDWLDGLNKHMRDWDIAHYGRLLNVACKNADMPQIHHPDDQYIVQIARFDPSKGILDVLESYQKFHHRLTRERPDLTPPKLLICGHGSVDDPDGAVIYDQVVNRIETQSPHLRSLVCAVRLRPSDQVLNAVLSKATIALQLSTREGFEVKVSEAVHKGVPIIATRAGGIPLQVQDGVNGFLVDVGDTDAVARHLFDLLTNKALYRRISEYAQSHVYDEVSTVGNALSWLYLASKFTKDGDVKPNGQWINNLAFAESGVPIPPDMPRLTREVEVEKMG